MKKDLSPLYALFTTAVIFAFVMGILPSFTGIDKINSCRSNLRQLNLAMQMYVQDYDGRYPLENWPEELQPYHKNNQLLICPADERESKKTSYVYNWCLANMPASDIESPASTAIMGDGTGVTKYVYKRRNFLPSQEIEISKLFEPRHRYDNNGERFAVVAYADGRVAVKNENFEIRQNPREGRGRTPYGSVGKKAEPKIDSPIPILVEKGLNRKKVFDTFGQPDETKTSPGYPLRWIFDSYYHPYYSLEIGFGAINPWEKPTPPDKDFVQQIIFEFNEDLWEDKANIPESKSVDFTFFIYYQYTLLSPEQVLSKKYLKRTPDIILGSESSIVFTPQILHVAWKIDGSSKYVGLCLKRERKFWKEVKQFNQRTGILEKKERLITDIRNILRHPDTKVVQYFQINKEKIRNLSYAPKIEL